MPTGWYQFVRLYHSPCVSILVLLDDAYRQDHRRWRGLWEGSFNPCSSGWCLPAFDNLSMPFLIFAFQSLFFWMMPTGFILVLLQVVSVVCFNPCSSGWCLPAPYFNSPSTRNMRFQSLFFWMMPTGLEGFIIENANHEVSILVLLDDAYRPQSKRNRSWISWSFNPCSSGWCLPAWQPQLAFSLFDHVSILVLLDDAYRLIYTATKIPLQDVSILVLLDDAYRHQRKCR